MEKLNIPFDANRNPLFDTMFVLQDEPPAAVRLPHLTAEPQLWRNREAKFDLTWAWQEQGDRLVGEIEYRADLWDEEMIERMARHYEWLLEQIVADPSTAVRELTLITPEELQLLSAWNDTTAPYPHEATVHGLFEAAADQYSERIAVEADGVHLTYRELNEHAERLASYLRSQGVQPRSFVGLMCQAKPERIIAIFAILKAGAAYVPLDVTFPQERLLYMLRDSGARWLLSDGSRALPEFDGKKVLLSDLAHGQSPDLAQQQSDSPAAQTVSSADDPLYLMYTSGSTGEPKGVVTTHRNVVKTCINNGYADITPADRMLQLSNYAFDGSTYEIFTALLNGATLVLIPEERRLDAEELAKTLVCERITTTFMTTSLFNTLVTYDARCLQGLSKLIFGGEAASPEHVNKALRSVGENKLINAYGPTETTVFATTYTIDRRAAGRHRIPIGKPINNTRCYVVNAWGQLQPIGVPGELWIAGDGLASAYWGKSDLTEEKFVTHPELPEERLYRTGDLVRWLADGTLEFCGRIDQQVKIRGNRIELEEVEGALVSMLPIAEAAAAAHRDSQGHSMLVAYVVPNDPDVGGRPPIAEWKKTLRTKLPDYMVPSVIVPLAALPLTHNGKLDRRALPAPNEMTQREYVAPRTEMEAALAELWQQLLSSNEVGTNDHFFELGGHSLTAMMLVALVREKWGIKLQLADLFRHPTLSDMARLIDTGDRGAFEDIPPAPKQADYPVTSAQLRLYMVEQFEDAKTSYNMPLMLRLTGKLDEERLQSAFRALIDRHEALRTSFVMKGDELRQVIHLPHDIDGGIERGIDVRHLPPADRQRLLDDYRKRFVRPFNLGEAPLIRAALCTVAEDEYELLLDMHHIVSDGVSVGILYDDLVASYEGQAPSPLSIQFKDVAVWQRERTKSPVLPRRKTILDGAICDGAYAHRYFDTGQAPETAAVCRGFAYSPFAERPN